MAEHPEPLDLAAIQADDQLLDRIGRGLPAPEGDELTGLLVGWRREIHDMPGPALCDLATALAALRSPRMPWWGRVQVWVLTRALRLLTPTPK